LKSRQVPIVKESHRHRLVIERSFCEVLDLNLRSLDIFVQIADSGGMSPTARRMGLTQSAVSQMIANLELSLGVQLFDRHVRPIALTPAGIILLNKARALLVDARAAIKAAREPAAAALPKLNLCLIETIAGTIGPDLVKNIQGFAALWSVHAGLHSQHNRALLSREADIVLTPDALEDEPHVERHEILKELYFIALPKDFEGDAGSLARLAESYDLVRFSVRTMLGRQIERHLRRLRLEARGRVEFDNAEAVLAMVAGGLGWAILTPLCALLGNTFWPQVNFVPLPGPVLHRRLHVIARQGELGDIPRKIADAAALCLTRVLDERFENYPWIVSGCHIPGAEALRAAAARMPAPLRAAAPPSSS
jgi:DNA-binding transcriptional LysR family regulator